MFNIWGPQADELGMPDCAKFLYVVMMKLVDKTLSTASSQSYRVDQQLADMPENEASIIKTVFRH